MTTNTLPDASARALAHHQAMLDDYEKNLQQNAERRVRIAMDANRDRVFQDLSEGMPPATLLRSHGTGDTPLAAAVRALVSEWATEKGREWEAARAAKEAEAKAEIARAEQAEAALPMPAWKRNLIDDHKERVRRRGEIARLLDERIMTPANVNKLYGAVGVKSPTFAQLAVSEIVQEWHEQQQKTEQPKDKKIGASLKKTKELLKTL
jgi:hypothetical protein